MASLKIYSKEQTDTLLDAKADTSAMPTANQLVPSVSGATEGDVLTVGSDGPEWMSMGGGVSIENGTLTTVPDMYALLNDNLDHAYILMIYGTCNRVISSQPYASEFRFTFSTNNIQKGGNQLLVYGEGIIGRTSETQRYRTTRLTISNPGTTDFLVLMDSSNSMCNTPNLTYTLVKVGE